MVIFLLALISGAIGAVVPTAGNGLADLLAAQGGMERVLFASGRIVGGEETTIEQFPWTVTMQRFGAHRCGASIISTTRVLTAAHCTVGIETSSLQIRAGATASQSAVGQFIQVSNVINHPAFSWTTLDNDITVMWLAAALNTAPLGVAVIGLPLQGAGVAIGAMAQVTGWGHTTENGVNSPLLRFVSVPIVSNAQCNLSYGGGITDGMICAGFPEGGRDACQNDSGGPLTLGGLQVGVVSWGSGCARPGFPGVYARVAFYRNWINASI